MSRRLIAVLTAAALLLSGCWSRREVNDLGAVTTLGIDQLDDGRLEISMAIPIPGGMGGGGKGRQQPGGPPNRVIVRRVGTTIGEAIRLAELTSPRRIGLDHSQIVLLGEQFARNGVDSLLDFLLRSSQVRLSSRILLVEEGTPSRLMETTPMMRPTHAEAMRELLSSRAGLSMTLKDFFIARTSNHISPIVPTIRLRPHPTSEEGAGPEEMELAGAAVFRGDHAALFLDQAGVRAAIWLLANPRDAVLSAPCPAGGHGMVSAKVAKATRKIKPAWEGGQLSFDVFLSGEIALTDLQCHISLLDPQVLKAVQDALRKSLADRVVEAVREVQTNELDPYGFGELVRAQLPAAWRQIGGDRWMQTWASVPVRVHPEVSVVHVNMTSAPPVVQPPAGN